MFEIDFPPRTNAAPWIETIELDSSDDGTPIDLSAYSVTLDIYASTIRGRGSVAPGLGFNFATGGQTSPAITASSANGKVTLPQTGCFTFAFTRTDMQTLAPGLYELRLRIDNTATPDTDGLELAVGTVPIIQG